MYQFWGRVSCLRSKPGLLFPAFVDRNNSALTLSVTLRSTTMSWQRSIYMCSFSSCVFPSTSAKETDERGAWWQQRRRNMGHSWWREHRTRVVRPCASFILAPKKKWRRKQVRTEVHLVFEACVPSPDVAFWNASWNLRVAAGWCVPTLRVGMPQSKHPLLFYGMFTG